MFSDHKGMKSEVNNRKKFGKFIHMQILHNTFLTNG